MAMAMALDVTMRGIDAEEVVLRNAVELLDPEAAAKDADCGPEEQTKRDQRDLRIAAERTGQDDLRIAAGRPDQHDLRIAEGRTSQHDLRIAREKKSVLHVRRVRRRGGGRGKAS